MKATRCPPLPGVFVLASSTMDPFRAAIHITISMKDGFIFAWETGFIVKAYRFMGLIVGLRSR